MTIPRARIVRSPPGARTRVEPLLTLGPGALQWRRIAREELQSRLAAEHVVQEAQSKADAIALHARDLAMSAAAQVARDAQEDAEAKVAARWLALKLAESARLEGDMDRVIDLGVVLAERLLGAALGLDPERVVDLARAVIAEASGARRVVIEAHPLDAGVLRATLGAAGLGARSVEVREHEELARGDLRLKTDIGTIDAKLTPRLERLAAALRDAFP
jgi:flagellar biosynthesis/type III secretory pathway protein FliH